MMQNLGILLITAILSCNTFLQRDTDSTYVVLQSDTARMVAAELIEKDLLVNQTRILRDSIGILQEIIEEQDSNIILYEQQKALYSLKSEEFEKQLQEDMLLQERLKQQAKTNKAWALRAGGVTIVAVTSTILMIILGK